MIEREDFIVWTKDKVTKAVYQTILHQIDGLKEELAQGAGKDPYNNGYRVGAIQAFRDVLAFHMDDIEDAN